jgi:hypothetical protein
MALNEDAGKDGEGGAVETARPSGAEVDAFLAREVHDTGNWHRLRAAARHGRDLEPAAD